MAENNFMSDASSFSNSSDSSFQKNSSQSEEDSDEQKDFFDGAMQGQLPVQNAQIIN